MNKILKISKLWLNRAFTVLIGLILTTNLNIHQAQAASMWDDIIQSVWAGDLLNDGNTSSLFLSVGGDALMSTDIPQPENIMVIVTAYSSTPDQTKPDDPFTMASGKRVYDGAVAANFLDFGTKIKIPSIFGDKIFIVEDRMARRFSDRIDIWFPTRIGAKRFGIQETEIEIL